MRARTNKAASAPLQVRQRARGKSELIHELLQEAYLQGMSDAVEVYTEKVKANS